MALLSYDASEAGVPHGWVRVMKAAINSAAGFSTRRMVKEYILHENKNMLALGKKLGFAVNRDPDSGYKKLVIHLGGNRP